jgi:thioredoxin-like negative regulator of GroEL
MKQALAALVRLLCTLAILGVAGLVNRSQSGDEASADSVRCELDPPGDIPGLEACLARSPRNVELVLDLADAYDAAGRPADARAQLARAAAIDPRDADVRRRLDERP